MGDRCDDLSRDCRIFVLVELWKNIFQRYIYTRSSITKKTVVLRMENYDRNASWYDI